MLRIRNAVIACLLMVALVAPTGQALAAIDTSNLTYPSLQSREGLTNPSLSYGLDEIADWSVEMPFIDLTKMGRSWRDYSGSLDEDGWPTSGGATMLWDWSHSSYGATESREGRYVLSYDGSGSINMNGVSVVSSSAGEIVFDLSGNSTWSYTISSTNSGDHIRNVSIVREDLVPLHEAGAIFNPDFIEVVKGARHVRYMDWMNTNNSDIESWDEWPHKDWYTWVQGAPVEVMVALANEIGADPWFTMPHYADDNFVRNFATYVETYLDPDLQAHVELSNETWNFAFDQTMELVEMGQAEWSQGSVGQAGAYYVKRATEMMRIWEDVFGNEADDRLVKVLAGQAGNTWLSENVLLNGAIWRSNEPSNWSDPTETFDALAVTSYFGHSVVRNSSLMSSVLGMSETAAFNALNDYLLDPSNGDSVPSTIEGLREHQALADSVGLDLILYEGGQHVHHSAFIEVAGGAATEALMTNYVRSPQMAELYQVLWDGWEGLGDGPFMNFTDVGEPSQWGSWGLRASLYDTNPRAELIDSLNASTPAWFASGGAHYQEGFIVPGTTGDNTLAGTAGVDTVVAGGGEDIIYPGPGNDYINGGADEDVVMLRGDMSDYSVRNEGDGYRVVGPDGSDYVYAVEILYFEDGSTQDLSGSVSLGSDPVTVTAGNTNVTGTTGVPNTNTNVPDSTDTTNEGSAFITTDNVNLRQTPGGEIIKVIPAGTAATVPSWNTPRVKDGQEWTMVKTEGSWGYMASDYLEEDTEGVGVSTQNSFQANFLDIILLIQQLIERVKELQAQLEALRTQSSDTDGSSVAENTDSSETDSSDSDTTDTDTTDATGGVTSAELVQHDSASDCWMAIDGTVYDLTNFIATGSHRPGMSYVINECGTNASSLFSQNHGGSAYNELNDQPEVGGYDG